MANNIQCARCGRLMRKDQTDTAVCDHCLSQFTEEEWRSRGTLPLPKCRYCGATIEGRSRAEVLAGTIRFCSTVCKQRAEAKVPECDYPEIVRLYSIECQTAGAIAKRYGCTSTVILKILRRFTTLRVGARPGVENYMYGRTHSPEARAKIRDANRAQFSTEAARARHGMLTAVQIIEGRTGKAFNKLEKAFAELLDDLGMQYQWQFRVERSVFDFLLVKPNTLIEIHGTFWHADPRFYDHSNLKPTQSHNIANDARKRQLAMDAGYRYAQFWEHDVHHNPLLIRSQLTALHGSA